MDNKGFQTNECLIQRTPWYRRWELSDMILIMLIIPQATKEKDETYLVTACFGDLKLQVVYQS